MVQKREHYLKEKKRKGMLGFWNSPSAGGVWRAGKEMINSAAGGDNRRCWLHGSCGLAGVGSMALVCSSSSSSCSPSFFFFCSFSLLWQTHLQPTSHLFISLLHRLSLSLYWLSFFSPYFTVGWGFRVRSELQLTRDGPLLDIYFFGTA